jgi:outer membrane protein assembly factor BamB
VTHKLMLHSAADGEAVAQLEAPCGGYVSALAFGADGILYVAGQDTALYALDLSAEL